MSRNIKLQNVSESKAESYKTTHNFFVLEEGRSNSSLQTYKFVVLKEILAFKNAIRVVERTEVEILWLF